MSIGDVLSEAWRLYTRFFGRFFATAAVVFVVLGLLNAVASAAATESAWAAFVWGVLAVVIGIVGYFWVQGALVEAVRDVRGGRADFTLGELYARVRPRLPALIAAGILAGIGIFLGLLLLVIPGLFLLTRWVLITPVVVLEERSAGEAFSRSWELVKGSSWQVFGLIVVTIVLAVIGSAVVGALLAAVLVFLPDFLSAWIGSTVVNAIVAPFVALAWTLAYFRLADAVAPAPAAEPAEL